MKRRWQNAPRVAVTLAKQRARAALAVVQVERDFEEIYATEDDPWGIGDADAERYRHYVELVNRHAGTKRASLLDIGCGFGAMLAQFRGAFTDLSGVEVSHEAVRKGSERYPDITLEQGSAGALEATSADGRQFSAIVYSDVIAYLAEPEKQSSLRWIAEHLEPNGVAFIAAWCPGGEYLTPTELRALVRREFAVEFEELLETDHAVFVCRPKRRLAAITVDHETWQPIPEGRVIDWERDIIRPTADLLDACDRAGARVTLMAEMGEYFFLLENDPTTAESIRAQWCDAVRRGHDVQLHLHPNWLPELGARRDGSGWHWDSELIRAELYPGDLRSLIRRCRRTLEDALKPVDPSYEVRAFRAGAYEAQPFRRLAAALADEGITVDSSVYHGPPREGRSFDYRLAYSAHQPYFASISDPQLKAPPAEDALVELPILTFAPGERWTFDGPEGARFADRFIAWDAVRARPPRVVLSRHGARLRWIGGALYHELRRWRTVVNRVVPRRLAWRLTDYPAEELVQHDYLVLVGHSKCDLQVADIERGIRRLQDASGVEFVTISEMARLARAELETTVAVDAPAEHARQIAREYATVLGDERNHAQSRRLQRMIPLDRNRLLDLGCGAGDWSGQIASDHPWMTVVGVDIGEDFISRAQQRHGSERVTFKTDDFAALSFDDGEFDCVYADNSLEHAFDVDATLAEAHRVLRDGGVVVAAVPSDARNPTRVCDNHTWKTAPHDVHERFTRANFVNVEVVEIDVYRRFGTSPYPPALDRVMYIRAWKRSRALTAEERLAELVRFTYESLSPETSIESYDAAEILMAGHAWCGGYAAVFGEAASREGYRPRWISMRAVDHPKGRGDMREDTHEVVDVLLDGRRVLVDPTVGIRYDTGLAELLRAPTLAAPLDLTVDERYRSRGYELYATSFWYERVRKVAVRPSLPGVLIYWDAHTISRWGTSLPAIAAGAAGGLAGLRRRVLRR